MTEETRPALRKDAERNRQRVLDAARELFAEKGLEATLNDVARYANVGVGTVYRRFATKEELIGAIFVDGMEQLTALAESALQHEDSWQGFAWYVESMCEITATDRGLREIAFSKAWVRPGQGMPGAPRPGVDQTGRAGAERRLSASGGVVHGHAAVRASVRHRE